MGARTIVVGDVHGCRQELEALLTRVSHRSTDDLVLVGDLVAKGPDSAGVVALCRAVGARAVRGNHDEHVLRWFRARREGRALPSLKPHHQQVCDTLTAADWAYLDALPLWLRLEGCFPRDVLVVHAGLDPRVSLEQQQPSNLMNMRSIRDDGRVSKRIEGKPWASVWGGPELVLFGHDAVRKLQQYPHAIGLDTGCVYGGALTAAVFEDGALRLEQVEAKRTWSEPEHPAEHRVCRVDELEVGRAAVVALGRDRYGLPLQGLVVLDDSGTPRGYLNVCKHLPIPLDGGTGDFFDDGRRHLFCGTHGALYRLSDGLCTAGPCEGEKLDPLELEVRDGVIFVKST